MTTAKPVLNFLCRDHRECEIAEALCNSEDFHKQEFWVELHDKFYQSARCMGFGYYEILARCHKLCVAVAPDCCHFWIEAVMSKLGELAMRESGCDAYVMGAQVGLFEAGQWLQERKERLLPGSFLPGMGAYCLDLISHRNSPVNVDGTLLSAQQALDRAVKGYLRPSNQVLANCLLPVIRLMLLTIKQGTDILRNDQREHGIEGWLFDSLVRGVLNIENRGREELVNAALALTPVT